MKTKKKIEVWKLEDVKVEDIDMKDYPDFCDAFIASATIDGRELTDEELNEVNEDYDYLYSQIENTLY